MNIKAVNYRYPDSIDIPGTYENDSLVRYEFKSLRFNLPSPIQVLKSLQCFLYQCTEGDIPEMLLYKALKKWEGDLAINIVQSMPEWDSAKWE